MEKKHRHETSWRTSAEEGRTGCQVFFVCVFFFFLLMNRATEIVRTSTHDKASTPKIHPENLKVIWSSRSQIQWVAPTLLSSVFSIQLFVFFLHSPPFFHFFSGTAVQGNVTAWLPPPISRPPHAEAASPVAAGDLLWNLSGATLPPVDEMEIWHASDASVASQSQKQHQEKQQQWIHLVPRWWKHNCFVLFLLFCNIVTKHCFRDKFCLKSFWIFLRAKKKIERRSVWAH